MRKSTVFSLSVSVLFAACIPGVVAQPSSSTNSKSRTFEVVLPVTVRDKKGAFATNLQGHDFTLTEDGRPQTIRSFTRDSGEPLRVGLVVDTSRTVSGAMEPQRKAITQFIDGILPADGESKNQVFLLHFDREVELLEDFTNSREKLHREVDEMGATRQERYDSQGPETTNDDRDRSVRHGHNGTQLYDAIFLAADELMKSKNGRKILVVFSNGADRGSKETLNDAIDSADRANLGIFTIFFKGQQERDLANEMPGSNRRGGMGGGWPGGGGGGYPGGGGGRRNPEPTSANGIDGKKIMQQIASRTGGHAFEAKKAADLEAIYKLIDEEIRNQYLLVYRPDKADDEGGFHKVLLKPNKEDLSVSVPEGYYAPEHK